MSGVSWKYKTAYFALKKEGILGGSFLDEEEIEETLNTLGREGWELVSFLDGSDGLFGVFKQMVSHRVPQPESVPTPLPPRDDSSKSGVHGEQDAEVFRHQEEVSAEDTVEEQGTESVVEEAACKEEVATTIVDEELGHSAPEHVSRPVVASDEYDDDSKENDTAQDEVGIGLIRIE